MEDLSALASRIGVAFDGLRGCLILDRDGLVLGCFPPAAETTLKPQWLRFAGTGEMEKAFVEFGDELWVYVRRGPYGAFAVGDTTIRPGLLIDHLEQALLSAEESRSKRDAVKIPEPPAAPSGRPRTSLHREPKAQEPEKEVAPIRAEATPAGALAGSAAEPAPPDPPAEPPPTEPPPPEAVTPPSEEEGDVDRVLLAQEFSRLLQEGSDDDEEV